MAFWSICRKLTCYPQNRKHVVAKESLTSNFSNNDIVAYENQRRLILVCTSKEVILLDITFSSVFFFFFFTYTLFKEQHHMVYTYFLDMLVERKCQTLGFSFVCLFIFVFVLFQPVHTLTIMLVSQWMTYLSFLSHLYHNHILALLMLSIHHIWWKCAIKVGNKAAMMILCDSFLDQIHFVLYYAICNVQNNLC